jgi:hypothetical protein
MDRSYYKADENHFKSFIKHRSFLKKAGVKVEYKDDDNSPYLYINNPIIISSFAGFIKKIFAKDNIYFRGESHNNEFVVPSLFRDKGTPLIDRKIIQNRFKAYSELKKDTIAHYTTNTRFSKEEVDTLFQHYGIKSPVIDLVDNIYVALWFAMDGNTSGDGFIRIMNTSKPNLTVFDLRRLHSTLSLRLHTQHGLIMKKNVGRWNEKNIYFDEYEVARIKFPVDKSAISGTLFSKDNIYPDVSLDNTYKILRNSKWFNKHITEIETKYCLDAGTLGKVV